MNEYRYILEPYNGANTRYFCPNCKHKTFVKYIDTKTGKHLDNTIGRCNREDKCGYHCKPNQYFKDNPVEAVSYIPSKIFEASFAHNNENNFIKYLIELFGREITQKLIKKYCIGTDKYGKTVFWQMDKMGRVRTGKIMQYDSAGHRYGNINWVHTLLKIKNFNLKQCLFGEHLLKDESKMVAIVESEKSAIISSIYVPEFIRLSCGGLSNLTFDKCKVLEGKNVVLFPDLNGYDKWNSKAQLLSKIDLNIVVSDLLEKNASNSDKENGLDLADYLIRLNYKSVRYCDEPPSTRSLTYPLYEVVDPFVKGGVIKSQKQNNSELFALPFETNEIEEVPFKEVFNNEYTFNVFKEGEFYTVCRFNSVKGKPLVLIFSNFKTLMKVYNESLKSYDVLIFTIKELEAIAKNDNHGKIIKNLKMEFKAITIENS